MATDRFQYHDYYLVDELLSEEHKLIRNSVREWVKGSFTNRRRSLPNRDIPKTMDQRTCWNWAFGPYIPAEYGGGGLDQIAYGLIMMELERGDSVCVLLHRFRVLSWCIRSTLMEAKNKKNIPKISIGWMDGMLRSYWTWSRFEPSGMLSNIKDKGDHYVLNGAKCGYPMLLLLTLLSYGLRMKQELSVEWFSNEGCPDSVLLKHMVNGRCVQAQPVNWYLIM